MGAAERYQETQRAYNAWTTRYLASLPAYDEATKAPPTNTYTKLKDGSWGAKVYGPKPAPYSYIRVTKKSGETKTERVERVVWSAADGSTHLVTLETNTPPRGGGQGASSGRYEGGGRGGGRGTRTGCRCGSVEEYAKSTDCASCRHDR